MKKPKWVVVLDFDGTLTPKSQGSLYDVIDKNGGLNRQSLRTAEKMRKYYLLKPTLTLEDQEKWFNDTVQLYVKSGLTLEKIEMILKNVRLRDGVIDCLRFLKSRNIPVAVVSYQIVQFVEAALKANGARDLIAQVYAANLFVDKRNRITGFDFKTAVFPENKGEFSCLFAHYYSVCPKRILAVGDSHVGDKFLGYLKENRLGIANDEMGARKLEGCMGSVVITDNFEPVKSWLEEKIKSG